MKISVSTKKPSQLKTELFAIPLAQKDARQKNNVPFREAPLYSWLDRYLKGRLSETIKRKGLDSKESSCLFVDIVGNPICKGVLCLNIPSEDSGDLRKGLAFQKIGRLIFKTAKEHRLNSVALDASSDLFDDPTIIEAILEGIYLASYIFDEYKSVSKEKSPFQGLKSLVFFGQRKMPKTLLHKIQSISDAVTTARNLCNMPACDCSPSYLAEYAKTLAATQCLNVKVLNEKDLQKIGANGILSVSQGSVEKPVLIKIHYKPLHSAKKTIGLVGKGVTFDSGGLCIKPSSGMEEMKHDMAGAAAVIGAMEAIAKLQPEIEVRAYVPVTENVLDGRSTKPGDVIKVLSGKTIEVINTDAEGRLILADALVLAEKDRCDEIIDLATLTGAAVVALGIDCAALYSPHDHLANGLLEAATASREYLWRMPLIDEYKEQLKSSVADLKNIGDKATGGGSISAALFLKEFIDKARWAHLDIAGPALRTAIGKEGRPGASGYGVRTLVNYVLSQARQNKIIEKGE